ncbi:unnamed protein product [Peronospora belbahrii]|uniref:Uncharacterized protein n=1 Tax=Peronospora belbahrii TaxID=622444 RepID=A0AAU9L8U7_9STRA|nr:unnamed protein product [Peronospora belbahrii]
MATNELAAILARRRAKAGGESEPAVPAVKWSASQTSEVVPSPAKSSIAERIARLKQQSAVASNEGDVATVSRTNDPVPALEPSPLLQASSSRCDATVTATALEPVDTSAVAAAQDAAGIRRSSSKIQQLQGSLGINVNPFGRSGGPSSGGNRKPTGYQRESIMTTGEEQYGHTKHAMGVSMPGMMGSAIPMPGLTKGKFRLPGMAPEGEQKTETPSASLDNSHATMNRVAGPARRGPTRMPPGAYRIPTMAAPNKNTVESSQAPATEPEIIVAAVAPAENLEPKAPAAPVAVSSPTPMVADLFPTPSPEPVLGSASKHATLSTPTPTPVPVPIAAATMQQLPEPELVLPMKPYELDDDPFAPVYDAPMEQDTYGATGFPSALLANFSMDELVLEDQSKPKAAATSTSATSHFGSSTSISLSEPSSPPLAAQVQTPVPTTPAQDVATHAVVREETPSPIFAPAPAPVVLTALKPALAPAPAPALAPAPAAAPTPVPVYVPTPTQLAEASTSTPAPVAVSAPTFSTPTPASPSAFVSPTTPTRVTAAATPSPAPASGTYLFGAATSAASDDDNSSESDWSDDDNGGQPLFGAQSTGSTKAEVIAPAATLVTPPQSSPEVQQSLTPNSGSLFGDVSCAPEPAPAVPAPGFVQATPQTAIPAASYSSLFGGAASSSSESDSESDDEGGLFG